MGGTCPQRVRTPGFPLLEMLYRRLLSRVLLDEFRDLVGHGSNISTLSPHEFDPNGDYKEVLQAVEKAGDGKARIYRLDQGRSRAEYYVVGHDQLAKRVVGLKAKAVES